MRSWELALFPEAVIPLGADVHTRRNKTLGARLTERLLLETPSFSS